MKKRPARAIVVRRRSAPVVAPSGDDFWFPRPVVWPPPAGLGRVSRGAVNAFRDRLIAALHASAAARPGRARARPLSVIPSLKRPLSLRPLHEMEAFKEEARRHCGLQRVSVTGRPFSQVRSDVVGFGYGVKWQGGQVVAPECVRIYVRAKLDPNLVPRAFRLPRRINGLPTDVIEAPRVRALATGCGGAIAGAGGEVGTWGCIVERAGVRCLLSNNHVIANCNHAPPGERVFDGAVPDTVVATLLDCIKLQFYGHGANVADAAIAKLEDLAADPAIAGIGHLQLGPVSPVPLLAVEKSGGATGPTSGQVEAWTEDFDVSFGGGLYGHFEGQISIHDAGGDFSAPGDSGSLVVTEGDHRPVGLLVGRDLKSGLNIASPIGRVCELLQITLVA